MRRIFYSFFGDLFISKSEELKLNLLLNVKEDQFYIYYLVFHQFDLPTKKNNKKCVCSVLKKIHIESLIIFIKLRIV